MVKYVRKPCYFSDLFYIVLEKKMTSYLDGNRKHKPSLVRLLSFNFLVWKIKDLVW